MADVKWSVYIHTCPNGKKYVGITSRKCEDRWRNGKGYRNNRHFYNAINKYGWENIKHEIVREGLTKEEAHIVESELIKLLNSNNHLFGYNHSNGGEGKNGFIPTQETRDKIRRKLSGRHRPLEVCKKVSESHKGKKLSKEQKEKIRMSCKNINGKPVICITTGIEYLSASEASRSTGVSRSGITACCRGETKSCRNTEWRYIEGGALCG